MLYVCIYIYIHNYQLLSLIGRWFQPVFSCFLHRFPRSGTDSASSPKATAGGSSEAGVKPFNWRTRSHKFPQILRKPMDTNGFFGIEFSETHWAMDTNGNQWFFRQTVPSGKQT